MSKTINSADQFSLFTDEPAPSVKVEPLHRSFDSTQLRIIKCNGEPCVLDLDLGRAVGYAEPRKIRELIRRLLVHSGWGLAAHRTTPIESGKGRHQLVTEYLLTEKQVILVCMRCELPNIDEVQSLIADVFIEWRRGNLRPTNAETETKLLDATDRALDQSPEAMSLFDEIRDAKSQANRAEEIATETRVETWRNACEFDSRLRKLELVEPRNYAGILDRRPAPTKSGLPPLAHPRACKCDDCNRRNR